MRLTSYQQIQTPTETFSSASTKLISKNPNEGKESFLDHLIQSLQEANDTQHTADRMVTHLAVGKNENIHETMLAMSQAELNLKMVVQVRNKVLEAYQDVMRMNV